MSAATADAWNLTSNARWRRYMVSAGVAKLAADNRYVLDVWAGSLASPRTGTPSAPAICAASRLAATALLVFTAALFIVARHFEPTHWAWGYVASFAAAATVGGVADWYAVVALFRRPLGLPIPHTAIIPRNHLRIADTLGEFIETNFLAPEPVEKRAGRGRLRGPGGRLAGRARTRRRAGGLRDAAGAAEPGRHRAVRPQGLRRASASWPNCSGSSWRRWPPAC